MHFYIKTLVQKNPEPRTSGKHPMATTIASTKSCSLSTFRIETTSRRTGQRTPPLLSLEDFFGKVNLELTNLTINEIHRNFQQPTASVLGIHGGACTLIWQRQGLRIEKAAMIGRNKITEWRAPKCGEGSEIRGSW